MGKMLKNQFSKDCLKADLMYYQRYVNIYQCLGKWMTFELPIKIAKIHILQVKFL